MFSSCRDRVPVQRLARDRHGGTGRWKLQKVQAKTITVACRPDRPYWPPIPLYRGHICFRSRPGPLIRPRWRRSIFGLLRCPDPSRGACKSILVPDPRESRSLSKVRRSHTIRRNEAAIRRSGHFTGPSHEQKGKLSCVRLASAPQPSLRLSSRPRLPARSPRKREMAAGPIAIAGRAALATGSAAAPIRTGSTARAWRGTAALPATGGGRGAIAAIRPITVGSPAAAGNSNRTAARSVSGRADLHPLGSSRSASCPIE